jgi:hypothetical protein
MRSFALNGWPSAYSDSAVALAAGTEDPGWLEGEAELRLGTPVEGEARPHAN